MYMYVYVSLNYFVVELKLTLHINQLYSNIK